LSSAWSRRASASSSVEGGSTARGGGRRAGPVLTPPAPLSSLPECEGAGVTGVAALRGEATDRRTPSVRRARFAAGTPPATAGDLPTLLSGRGDAGSGAVPLGERGGSACGAPPPSRWWEEAPVHSLDRPWFTACAFTDAGEDLNSCVMCTLRGGQGTAGEREDGRRRKRLEGRSGRGGAPRHRAQCARPARLAGLLERDPARGLASKGGHAPVCASRIGAQGIRQLLQRALRQHGASLVLWRRHRRRDAVLLAPAVEQRLGHECHVKRVVSRECAFALRTALCGLALGCNLETAPPRDGARSFAPVQPVQPR